MSFHLSPVRILGSMGCGKIRNDYFHKISWRNNLKLKKYYAETIIRTTGIEIQSQH